MTAPGTHRPQQTQGTQRTEQVFRALSRHGNHSSAFLTMGSGLRHLSVPGDDGFVAHRTAGRHMFELCGPVCADADRERLLAALLDRAAEERRKVVGVQLSRRDAELHAAHDFTADQLGASFSIALDGYSLGGRRMVKVRNMVNRARKEGVTADEASPADRDGPELAAALDGVDAAWLRAKGRHVKELDFMIGERGGPGAPYRRLFTAVHQGRIVAYVSYSPVFGERPGWLYDLTRRTPEAPPGTIDLVFATALRRFQDEGSAWLHLGFTPFVQLEPLERAPGRPGRGLRPCLELVRRRGAALYPAAAQESFKLKWRPQLIEPEYLAFQGGPSPRAVWDLLRLTRTV
ncbi:phosphatidylglycerol lysyltransferase domain-containing protein [Streptomyces purpureus]|uniref:phosphatidylglycerol lysyltransferase domain-containing protein n=1 Tax=Streptomyces purpureus TaxID=1951 RepID=UPI0037BCC057